MQIKHILKSISVFATIIALGMAGFFYLNKKSDSNTDNGPIKVYSN